MKTEKLIKEAHADAVARGEYNCPDCGGSGKHAVDKLAWDNLGNCCNCKGTGVYMSKNTGEMLIAIISELGRALKSYRCEQFADRNIFDLSLMKTNNHTSQLEEKIYYKSHIKDTFEDNIADAFIRLFELCGYMGIDIDLNMYDWDKYTDEESFFDCVKDLSSCSSIDYNLSLCGSRLMSICRNDNIDIEKHIEAKLEYNNNRR